MEEERFNFKNIKIDEILKNVNEENAYTISELNCRDADGKETETYKAEEVYYYLGLCYYLGQDIPQDYEKAKMYFEKILNEEYDELYYKLAVMYSGNCGIDKNEEKVIEYYNKIELDLCIALVYYVMAVKLEEDWNLNEIFELLNLEKNIMNNMMGRLPTDHPALMYYNRLIYLKKEEYNDVVERLKNKILKCKTNTAFGELITFFECDDDIIFFAKCIVKSAEYMSIEECFKNALKNGDVETVYYAEKWFVDGHFIEKQNKFLPFLPLDPILPEDKEPEKEIQKSTEDKDEIRMNIINEFDKKTKNAFFVRKYATCFKIESSSCTAITKDMKIYEYGFLKTNQMMNNKKNEKDLYYIELNENDYRKICKLIKLATENELTDEMTFDQSISYLMFDGHNVFKTRTLNNKYINEIMSIIICYTKNETLKKYLYKEINNQVIYNSLDSFSNEKPCKEIEFEVDEELYKFLNECKEDKKTLTEITTLEDLLDYANTVIENEIAIDTFCDNMDFRDKTQIMQYGKIIQANLSELEKIVLDYVEKQQTEKLKEVLNFLKKELERLHSCIVLIEKRRIFHSLKKDIKKTLITYNNVEKNIERVLNNIDYYRIQRIKYLEYLSSIYKQHLEDFKQLAVHIMLGEKKLEELKTGMLSKLQEDSQENNCKEEIINILEERIQDLKKSIQLIPKINLIKENGNEIWDKIYFKDMWKIYRQINLNISELKNEQSISDTILKERCKVLRQEINEFVEKIEKGISYIETLQKLNINTLNEEMM